MAAILEKVFEGKIETAVLIDWLQGNKSNFGTELDNLANIRQEFVPFLLNFLRDQTAHLMQGCRSTANTPAKTPLSAKLKKTGAAAKKHTQESRKPGNKGRVQLFNQEVPVGDDSRLSDNSLTFVAPPRSKNSPHATDTPRSQRSIQFTPDSSKPPASRHKNSLRDFLTPESGDRRKKKSPHSKKEETPSPLIVRKSTGKKSNDRRYKNHGNVPREINPPPPPPDFSIDADFPSLSTSTPNKDINLPSGVKVITQARRVTTTLINPSIPNSRENKAWSKGTSKAVSALISPCPGSVASGAFASPTRTDEERKFLRELKQKRQSFPPEAPETPTKTATVTFVETTKEEVTAAESVLSPVKVDRIQSRNETTPLKTCKPSDIEGGNTARTPMKTPTKGLLDRMPSIVEFTKAEKEEVSHIDELNILADIYSRCITENLVLNLTVELYFLIQLLTTRGGEVDLFSAFPQDLDEVQYFQTVHNAVHFAVEVLSKQKRLLALLDKGTLRLLVENQRIIDFLPELHEDLEEMHQTCPARMCKVDQSINSEGDDENIALLTLLKQHNPEKFKRLQERFVTRSSMGGPCPPPSFPGCQEFFRDFILAASSAPFIQHLTNALVAKLVELDRQSFTSTEAFEDEEEPAVIEAEERQALHYCLVTLRLLGKFLGYVTFLPYLSHDSLPASMCDTLISMRNQVSLPLSVLPLLSSAVSTGRLVLTVPWVVDYLSMLDPSGAQLVSVQRVFASLITVHRQVSRAFARRASHAYLLVLLMLGWLFELSIFPDELLFADTDPPDPLPQCSFSLDTLGLVDQQILYTYCPYLGELRTLLVDFAVGTSSRNNNNIRKITPISTEIEPMSSAVSEQQLQSQLVENFFHNQPASMKRSIEFVADRVASKYIKHFRTSMLPALIEEGVDEAKQVAKKIVVSSPDGRLRRRGESQVQQLGSNLTAKLRKHDKQNQEKFCVREVCASLPLLLAMDTEKGVIAIACDLAAKQAMEKVNTWIMSNITTTMINKELIGEYDKAFARLLRDSVSKDSRDSDPAMSTGTALPPKEKSVLDLNPGLPVPVVKVSHDEEALSPAEVLCRWKYLVRDTLLGSDVASESEILENVKIVDTLLVTREDTLPVVCKSISRLSIELSYCLCLEHPEHWTDTVASRLIQLWKSSLCQHASFDSIICPKHLHQLQRSKTPQASWAAFTSLLLQLLQDQMVDVTALDYGCRMLHSNNTMTKDCISHLTYCLCTVITTVYSSTASQLSPPLPLPADELFYETVDWLHQLTEDTPPAHDIVLRCRQTIQAAQEDNERRVRQQQQQQQEEERRSLEQQQQDLGAGNICKNIENLSNTVELEQRQDAKCDENVLTLKHSGKENNLCDREGGR